LSVGAGLQWSTFAYASAQVAPEAFEKRAQALEIVGELQGRLQMLDWLVVRVDVGGGGTWFSGFDTWNEIADDGLAAAEGFRPTVRAALGAEVALPLEGLSVRVTPVGGILTAGPSGAGPELGLSMTAGIGFQL